MGETRNLADLFAQIWLRLERGDALAVRQAENLVNRLDEVGQWRRKLDDMVTQAQQKGVEILERWIEDTGSGVTFEILERQTLVAQAIERWYQQRAPDWKAGGAKNPDLGRASLMLMKHGRFNEDRSLGAVILKRPRSGQFFESQAIPRRNKEQDIWSKVSNLFDHLIRLPNQIDASDPDDRTTPRSIAIRYVFIHPRLIRRMPDEFV